MNTPIEALLRPRSIAILNVLVQPMAEGDVELVIGLKHDSVFGSW